MRWHLCQGVDVTHINVVAGVTMMMVRRYNVQADRESVNIAGKQRQTDKIGPSRGKWGYRGPIGSFHDT